MHITEISSSLKLFTATVKARYGVNNTATLKTAIYAEGPTQARQMLMAVYGVNGVMSLMLDESTLKSQRGTQTLTADQLKLKSLADQKSLVGQNEKRERARQKLVKAQQSVQKANAARLSVGS